VKIPYGFRTSVGDVIIFHKPEDVITNNTSPNQLEFPFGLKFQNDSTNFKISSSSCSLISFKYGSTMSFTDKNLELTGSDNTNKVIISNGIQLLTENNNDPFTIQSIKYGGDKNIIIPYGTDLTNYNKIIFRQSIIDKAIINNPEVNLYDKIKYYQKFSTTIKTTVGENVFPKTTHTFLTCYYTSYIEALPQTTDSNYKPLLQYFCTNVNYPAIEITVINSTVVTPQIYIKILQTNGSVNTTYTISQYTPIIKIDLTADLAVARSGQEIISAQLTPNNFGGFSEPFYHYCVNILSNVFISYTYDN
jgi:hypothetical protein